MRNNSGFHWIILIAAVSVLFFAASGCSILQKNRQPADQPVLQPGEPDSGDPIREEPIQAVSLEIVELLPILAPSSSQQLKVVSRMSDGSSQDVTASPDTLLSIDNPQLAVIDKQGSIHVSAEARTGQSFKVTAKHKQLSAEFSIKVKYALEDTVTVNASGFAVVTNPTDIVVVVNKQRSLPGDYVPADLVKPDIPFYFNGEHEKKYVRKEAAEALEQLFQRAEQDGIRINAVSGYRAFNTQKYIFERNVERQGEEEARRYSAYPGQSEHQTGLAMDISSPSIGNVLEETFGETAEGKWLAEHAAQYGFIIRYPQGKEHITGYAYEPWHLRYVGVELAEEIAQHGVTLEEYFMNTESTPVSKQAAQ
jgi:D-alanyl-D-alanine carboxypeptidase